MPAFLHALGDTAARDGQRRKPEEIQVDAVSGSTGCAEQRAVAASAQSGFKSKTRPGSDEFIQACQHETSRPDGGAFGCEGRQSLRNHVRIDELQALHFRRQEAPGVGGLSHAIRSSEDIELRCDGSGHVENERSEWTAEISEAMMVAISSWVLPFPSENLTDCRAASPGFMAAMT